MKILHKVQKKQIIIWLEQYNNQILITSLIIGAVLRWLRIDAHGFWFDEAFSGLIAKLTLAQILTNVTATVHPPGYYALLHYWLTLGQTEAIIRSLSALFSLAAIPLLYGLGHWLFGRPTAALAALLMALAPFQVYYAQETRMYSLIVFLAATVTWLFLRSVILNNSWLQWLSYAIVAVLGLYVHYFVAFLLFGLHLWWLINVDNYKSTLKHLILTDALVALLFLPQLGQAFTRTSAYLGGVAWQVSPYVLSPLTTIYYLLFVHRSPSWIFPIAIFLTLTVLILTLWESRRRPLPERRLELSLWLSLVTPIVIVMLISWLIRPIYLERSFAIASPALILLIARGAMAAPRQSPTPYLVLILLIPMVVTLIINIITPDPAKPPVREVTRTIEANFAPGDVSLHLQDASFLPATWYTLDIQHILIEQGVVWLPVADHRLFGGDMLEWQSALKGADRLWLTIMPGFLGPEQEKVLETIEATYPRLNRWDWGSVQLYLYDLRDANQ